jgi:2-oxo-3-hexenedioate decarboxylase
VLDPQDVANDLIAGERERREIPQFSKSHGVEEFDLATAYRAQRLFVAAKLDAGQRFVGYKLGLTSRNKQQAMGVDAPQYGRVTSGMIATHGEPIRLDRFIHPWVESEIGSCWPRHPTTAQAALHTIDQHITARLAAARLPEAAV